jgi:hypothetical protein
MADWAGDIEGGEVVIGLGLLIVIGYFIYQFSQSACQTINALFGLSVASCTGGNPANQPGGSYTNAANQVITNPLTSLETILGMNQTIDPGATNPSIVGSSYVTSPTGSALTNPPAQPTASQSVTQAYVTGSSL